LTLERPEGSSIMTKSIPVEVRQMSELHKEVSHSHNHTNTHDKMHQDNVTDAYGPVALLEAQKVRNIVRNLNSPEAGYADLAKFLDKHDDNPKLAATLIHDLNKLDGHILPDLAVVYEKDQLSNHNDGLKKSNSVWDNAMAQGVANADLRGHARKDNLDLQEQTLDSNHVRFDGLSAMIERRNADDPGQAASDMLADDSTGTLRSAHGNVLHLTNVQRDALEKVKSDYEVRAGLYPNLYQQDVYHHTNDSWARGVDGHLPSSYVIPKNAGLFAKGVWDWLQHSH
jgi:hypothetical protein